MKKRVLSMFMALALCLTLLPTAALAAEPEGTAQTPPAVEESTDPANGEAKQENQPAAPEQEGQSVEAKQESQSAEQEEQQEDSAAKQAVAAVQAMIGELPSLGELKGMDSDTLAHLFDRFMDGGQDPMPPRGLGLGLPICQRIAQGHGGMIVAQSEEGKGSLFTVSLPAVKAGRVQLKDRGSDYAGGFNRTLVEMSDALSSEAFLQKYLD